MMKTWISDRISNENQMLKRINKTKKTKQKKSFNLNNERLSESWI
jgi:hypothetical protein